MSRSYQIDGIVLKRTSAGEGDRIITFFTRERGKIVAIAKGVRKLSSKRAASLETGTRSRCYIRIGKNLGYITQAIFVDNYQTSRDSLTGMIKIQQILEIVDRLTVEEQPAPEVYDILLSTLEQIEKPGQHKKTILKNIRQIIQELGFTYDKEFTETGLKRYIEEISEKKLRTKPFLTPK